MTFLQKIKKLSVILHVVNVLQFTRFVNACSSRRVKQGKLRFSDYAWYNIFVAVFSLSLLASSLKAEAPVNEGVVWETDFRQGIETAKNTNKLILLHFYSNNCPPCKQMDMRVFPRNDVAEALAKEFVTIKVDTELNPKAVQNLNIVSIPADLIVTHQGQIVYRRAGGTNASQYVNELLAAVHEFKLNSQPALAKKTETNKTETNKPELTQKQTNEEQLSPPQLKTSKSVAGDLIADNPVTGTSNTVTPNVYAPIESANVYAPVSSAAPQIATSVSQYEPVSMRETVSNQVHGGYDYSEESVTGLTIPSRTAVTSQEMDERLTPPSVDGVNNEKHSSIPYVLDGFCPVELQDSEQWVAGNQDCALIFRGQFYLFSNLDSLHKFAKNPTRYTPVAHGEDVVQMALSGERIKGKRNFGAWYHGRIYLFANQENYESFAQRPSYYSGLAKKLEIALGEQLAVVE